MLFFIGLLTDKKGICLLKSNYIKCQHLFIQINYNTINYK